MTSQKKCDLKLCLKCAQLLTIENWKEYDKKVNHYICSSCRKEQDKIRQKIDVDYNKKQLGRYHSRRSAVIHAYDDACIKCGEDNYGKLIIKNINTLAATNINYLYNNSVNKNNYQVLCYNCSKSPYYDDKYALRDKIKVIEAYGNKCCLCDEDRIQCLMINKNDTNRETGVKLYRWIIKNSYPDNLQLICYNCYNNNLLMLKFLQELEREKHQC